MPKNYGAKTEVWLRTDTCFWTLF